MRKTPYLIIFFSLIALFVLISRSIVGVKLQELRFGILRDQLMNYELSSQTLKERLKQMFLSREDYFQEVKVNVLESNVMNSETKGMELNLQPNERVGLVVVNTVRLMNLKPQIALEEQQKVILRMQFAFYMERTRKYSIAVKKYDEIEDLLSYSLSDERAFASLHAGYCLVMMGEREKAFVKLQKTIDLFPGSHYSENAQLLINFLRDSTKRKGELKQENKDPEVLAYSLFQAGDYEETLKTLESLPKLSNDQNYIKARAMEELGKTSNAVKEYIRLVKQKENKEIAIRANRRLLLIGNFYQESKSLVEYSKREATKLGDEKAANQIEEGKALVQKPLIIEKILKEEEEKGNSDLKEFKESIAETLTQVEKETEKTLAVVKSENIPLVPEEEKKLESFASGSTEIREPLVAKQTEPIQIPTMTITLRDGRKLIAEFVESEGSVALLKIGNLKTEVPWEFIDRIESKQNFYWEGTQGNNSQSNRIYQEADGSWTVAGSNLKIPQGELNEIRFR